MHLRENTLYNKQWESKQFLAKILARENIRVVFSHTVKTAYFDMKNRLLIVPKWEDMSEHLMDMMLGHEVAHALYTNSEEWKRIILALRDYYLTKKPKAQNALNLAEGYVQILEDVRINRLIKQFFPGLRRDFAIGGRELLNRGFFTVQPRDTVSIFTHMMIDIVCLWDKAGKLDLFYILSHEEEDMLDQVMKIETMNEVYEWGKKLIDYDLQRPVSNEKKKNNKPSESDQEKEESDGSPSSGESPEEEPSEAGEDAADEHDTTEDVSDTDSGEASETTEDTEDESEEQDRSDGTVSSDDTSENESNDGEDSDPEREDGDESSNDQVDELHTPKEIESYNDKLNDLAPPEAKIDGENHSTSVINFPVPHSRQLKPHVMEYKDHLVKCKILESKYKKKDLEDAAKAFDVWKGVEFPHVKHMINQFNMKKAARAWEKSHLSTKGDLNTAVLHSYKTRDDLFIRNRVIPKGKNHGFVILLDWSSSMNGILHSVVKQAISFAYFCRKLRIPFEVYNFNNGALTYGSSNFGTGGLSFSSGHHLRCMLSSEMTSAEFDHGCRILFYRTFDPLGLGYNLPTIMTPLCFSTFLMIKIVEDFKNKHSLDVTNYIAITDGGNTDNCSPSSCIIFDPVTGLSYEMMKFTQMNTLLKIMKDRNNVNTFNIFLNKGPELYNQGAYWKKTTKNVEHDYDVRFDVSGAIHDIKIDGEEGTDQQKLFKEKNILLTNYIEYMSKNI